MSTKLAFDLVSPERLFFSGAVDMVTLPGAEGDFGVLYAHAPAVSLLRAGVIDVANGNDPVKRIYVRGGFAEVSVKGLTVLAEHAMPVEEIDRSAVEADLKAARENLADAKTDVDRAQAQKNIDVLAEMLTLVG
jgi:F-type H+-transporting ATPase subunit epsilon